MAVKLNRLLTQGRHTALVVDVFFVPFFFGQANGGYLLLILSSNDY